MFSLADHQPRRVRLDEKAGDALAFGGVGIGYRPHDKQAGIFSRGDVEFLAVQNKMIAIAPRFRAQARRIRTSACFGQAEGAGGISAACQPRQIALALFLGTDRLDDFRYHIGNGCRDGGRGAGISQLFDRQREGDRSGLAAAIGAVDAKPHEAILGQDLQVGEHAIASLATVKPLGQRRQTLIGDASRRIAHHGLRLAQSR